MLDQLLEEVAWLDNPCLSESLGPSTAAWEDEDDADSSSFSSDADHVRLADVDCPREILHEFSLKDVLGRLGRSSSELRTEEIMR